MNCIILNFSNQVRSPEFNGLRLNRLLTRIIVDGGNYSGEIKIYYSGLSDGEAIELIEGGGFGKLCDGVNRGVLGDGVVVDLGRDGAD